MGKLDYGKGQGIHGRYYYTRTSITHRQLCVQEANEVLKIPMIRMVMVAVATWQLYFNFCLEKIIHSGSSNGEAERKARVAIFPMAKVKCTYIQYVKYLFCWVTLTW